MLALLCIAALSVPVEPPRAPVVVALIVDQFASWVASDRLPKLTARRPHGGFARLLREGTWVERSEYPFAATETAPGHAALFTGTLPSENGIVGNLVFRDDLTPPRLGSLIDDGTGSVSLDRLRRDTIANRLLALHPQATIVSLSLKDRGAIFAAPRPPRTGTDDVHVVWQDGATGQLLTSSAFASRLPPWAANHPILAERVEWKLLDPEFVAAHAATVDDTPQEDNGIGGRTFPHVLEPGDPDYWEKWQTTPRGTELLVSLALAAIDGNSGRPLLLSISLSTPDLVGHSYGPDSWETWDALLRLDDQLAALLGGLDRRFGVRGYSVVLTADHGIVPLPDTETDPRLRARQDGFDLPPAGNPCGMALPRPVLLEAARAAAGAEWIVALTGSVLVLDREKEARLAQRDVLHRTIQDALQRVHGVKAAYDLDTEICPVDLRIPPDSEAGRIRATTLCEGGRSRWGSFYIVTEPGTFLVSDARSPSGVNHGSPHLYDRMVPLIVRYADLRRADAPSATTFRSFTASLWCALTLEQGRCDTRPFGPPVGRDKP